MISKKESLARLTHLANILDKTPMEKGKHHGFHMGSWFQVLIADTKAKVDRKGNCKIVGGSCGTTACALGHAALDPKFQKLGLKIDDIGEQFNLDTEIRLGNTDFYVAKEGSVKYRGKEGLDAAMAFFGINETEATRLFQPGEYYAITSTPASITPQDVANRVRELISNLEARA